QYLVTDDIPEVYERGSELPHVMDPEGESYLRQEGRGLVIGFYEHQCEPWGVNGTPADFGHELLPDKLERIGDAIETAYRRYPVLERAGVKTIINGPFTFAPDGNPLVGPVPGLRNYWSACAVMAGFSQGGGVGLTLAEWMIEGEPSRDVFAMDVARFGEYATAAWARNKVVENYQRRFSISYPNEELPVGRPLDTTPAYEIWKAQRAVFGAGYGMEHANYFAPEGEPVYEVPSFRRSNAFAAVSEECRAVRTAVGINEVHNFGKYEVSGPGAAAWLDRIMAGRIPKAGRISLTPMLSPKGRLIGDFTISRLAEDRFQLTASFSAQAYHMRWFQRHLPEDGSVRIRNVSSARIGFQIAGPNARELLARVTPADVSREAFPFLSVRPLDVGLCEALVQRVTYTGDLGYEIYVPAAKQVALYYTLATAWRDLGLRPFGMRAMMSLRLEKSFGSWLREFKPDYTPQETGLDRFVAYNKPADFIGKAAAAADKAKGPSRRLCTFVVEADDADVWADEPIWHGGKVVGFVTSGGYAHYVEKSVALGFLPTGLIADGREVEIEILGDRRPARLVSEPLFDPAAERLRG
ncbi:MAG TPA: FAD-dependent oxidoreductase, partial [Kiloniellales bacterium]